MPERVHSPLTYIVIDLVLVLLTILTVAVSFLEARTAVHLASGLVIGLIKASLVAMFFMHVLGGTVQTKAVIAVTIFWLIVVFGGLTFSDYVTRGAIPFLPGH